MCAKVVTSIYIDEELLKEAKELGLNVSKVAENSLKEKVRLLRSHKTPKNTGNSSKTNVDGAGFEPASSVLTNELSLLTNEIQRLDDGGVHRVLDEFGEWLEIDELRRPRTVGHHFSILDNIAT